VLLGMTGVARWKHSLQANLALVWLFPSQANATVEDQHFVTATATHKIGLLTTSRARRQTTIQSSLLHP
jgi:hypothetical protein